MPVSRPLALLLLASAAPLAAQAGVEVLEIHPGNTDALPRGKEADGIIGDFVMRNAHVEALVSGGLPNRKANMGTHWNLPTPGCLYDLAVRGSDNDQLTFLGPGSLQGTVSSVRRIDASANALGVPGIRTERTAATGRGRGQRHDYLLGADWRCLAILSTYENRGEASWTVDPDPRWKEFSKVVKWRGIWTGDATNPSDRHAYAVAVSEWSGELALGEPAKPVALRPGESRSFLTIVAPGRSPAEAFGRVAAKRGDVGRLSGRVTSGAHAVTSATILIALDDKRSLRAYTDDRGRLDVQLPPGAYRVNVRDLGRPPVTRQVRVRAGETTVLDFELAPAARVAVVTRDPEGRAIPCKVRFVGVGGAKDPHFGVDIQAHGCRNVYMAETGSFEQQVDPGEYRLIVTRGIEYDRSVHDVEVRPGELTRVEARLTRVVQTPGWVSTDFHNHSTPSGDNYCGTDDRLINLAVEHVEFAPTTEHNRIYDWTPHIERLGLAQELRTVPGIELTGPAAHFNAFPLKPVPFRQDNGAPHWHADARVTAIVLRDFQGGGPFRWVHLNHPDVGRFFRDRNRDGIADGGFDGLEMLIDAAEVWSLDILTAEPELGADKKRPNRTFAWLQLLNQGAWMNCLAVADAHKVYDNACGGWRTYVRSSDDRPAHLSPHEVIRNSKAGRMFMTTGPYLEVRLDDGTGIGGQTVARGPIRLHVRVQCTDWLDINRVQVMVNGRQPGALNFTRKSHPQLFASGVVRFEHAIPVQLHEDAHLIVVAVGEGLDLRAGWGKARQGGWAPCAFTNPIRVDVDGHGWRPNGDTLGHPLPTGK